MASLCIADPPYPPMVGSGGTKNRASRWYGDGQLSRDDARLVADRHPDAALWDDPAAHVALMARLADEFDAWAIATTPDGLAAYGLLPVGARLMAWVKPGATPTAHRIASGWEMVITYPMPGRRSSRTALGQVPDVLTCAPPRSGFIGAKPSAWTRWVLDALSYDPDHDTVLDLFNGSGAIAAEVAQGVLL